MPRTIRASLLVVLGMGLLARPALATNAHRMSMAGQAPQTWTHEPGPNDQIDRFQVIFVDDHSCPAGQIKKFTSGSRQLGVRATRECVSR